MSADLFTWLKALHIMAFAAWMAAMWYLPRLMVYHSDTEPGSEVSSTFEVMERRLLKAIGTPAMIATWVFGLGLAFELSAWSDGWFHAKMLLVGLHERVSRGFSPLIRVASRRANARNRRAGIVS